MFDLSRLSRIERRLNNDEFNLLLFLKPFQRFYENSEFYDLLEGLLIECELKALSNNIEKLISEKSQTISTICELEKSLDVDKKKYNTESSLIEKIHGNKNNSESQSNKQFNSLGQRLHRFTNFNSDVFNEIFGGATENNFEENEFNLIKEMPLARSTCYFIIQNCNKIFDKNKEQGIREFDGIKSEIFSLQNKLKQLETNNSDQQPINSMSEEYKDKNQKKKKTIKQENSFQSLYHTLHQSLEESKEKLNKIKEKFKVKINDFLDNKCDIEVTTKKEFSNFYEEKFDKLMRTHCRVGNENIDFEEDIN